MSSEPFKLSDEWHSIKLGQLLKLVQVGEYGKRTRDIWKTDPATFSRDITSLEHRLGVELTKTEQGDTALTPSGKLLTDLFGPVLDLCNRISQGEIAHLRRTQIRIGAGGSLAAWLIGARLPEVKNCFKTELIEEPAARLRRVNVEIQAFRNRDTLLQVVSGALDCGLVREGVLTAARTAVPSRYLGTVDYYLYVPEKLLVPAAAACDSAEPLPEELEDTILNNPIATVGPHGEFYRELMAAFYNRGIFPNIEYLYRAFPMLMPHMHMKTHVTIMPHIRKLEGNSIDTSEVPGYRKFPFRLLKNYKRRIFLAFSPDHARRAPALDVEALASVLRFDHEDA